MTTEPTQTIKPGDILIYKPGGWKLKENNETSDYPYEGIHGIALNKGDGEGTLIVLMERDDR